MKILTISKLSIPVFVFLVFLVFMTIQPNSASAQTCYYQGSQQTCPAGLESGKCYNIPVDSTGELVPVEINCADGGIEGPALEDLIQPELPRTTIDTTKNVTSNPIYSDMLLPALNFLTAGVALVVTTLVVVGGIQYMTAGGNPQKTQAAIIRISNALIGLVIYLLMFAILQWLIPGGIFG